MNKDTTRFDVSWPPTGDSNIKANAMGLRKVLNWISQHFTQNEPLLIAASGLSDNSRVDVQGSEFMVQNKLQYINEALKGMTSSMQNCNPFFGGGGGYKNIFVLPECYIVLCRAQHLKRFLVA